MPQKFAIDPSTGKLTILSSVTCEAPEVAPEAPEVAPVESSCVELTLEPPEVASESETGEPAEGA